MAETIKITISLQKSLYDQAENLAKRLNIFRNQLFEIAAENFILNYQGQGIDDEPRQAVDTAGQTGGGRRAFHQGDIYWVLFDGYEGSETGINSPAGVLHPYVIIQDDVFNRSRIHTVVVCALTSNMKRAKSPGNVLLEAREANLPRQSVVEVSKVSAVYKKQLGDYIGSLSKERIDQILAGMQFLQRLGEHRETGEEP